MGRQRKQRRSDIPQRLIALGGLIVIVGGVIGVLLLADLLGNQGGGEGIKDVLLLEPPRAASQADIKTGPQVGRLAPDFEISDFDGTRHRLSDFRGKPVYVNFWATWCVPCTMELPDIQVLEQRHSDDLAVITVNRRESLNTARAYSQNIALRDGGTGVSFTVNAGSLEVCIPADVGVRVQWSSTLASNNLDSLGLEKVGEEVWQTSGYGSAATQIDMNVTANAGSFELTIGGGCGA